MSEILKISSHSNPKYKWLKSLSKSRNRRSEGVFLMEGRPELDHALKTHHEVELAVFSDSYISEEELKRLVGDVRILQLDKALFDDISYQHVPDNFILVLKSWHLDFDDLDSLSPIVVLEGLEKPGNLGAILRTCDASGINQIIMCDSEIDLFNPNVLRNSRGAVFSTACVFADNDRTLQWLKSLGYRVRAAALTEDAVPFSAGRTDKSALVFGAESKGLTPFWINNSDETFALPMNGVVDSLNLSVTVGIVLYNMILE